MLNPEGAFRAVTFVIVPSLSDILKYPFITSLLFPIAEESCAVGL
jgi:hypothetical protein